MPFNDPAVGLVVKDGTTSAPSDKSNDSDTEDATSSAMPQVHVPEPPTPMDGVFGVFLRQEVLPKKRTFHPSF